MQTLLHRVQGRVHAGGALPFAIAAAAAFAIAAAAAAFTIAPNGHDKRAAAYAAPARDLLRALSRDCDIVLQLSKLQWGRDMLAYRVRAQVPQVRGSRDPTGGALPFTRSPPRRPRRQAPQKPRSKLTRPTSKPAPTRARWGASSAACLPAWRSLALSAPASITSK